MLLISHNLTIPEHELHWQAIRAQGAGGQNVNKVSSAVHLRFDVPASSLPEEIKQRILDSRDRRISQDGVIVIKAQRYRSQEKNLTDARERLVSLILSATTTQKPRKPTRPSRASQRRRVEGKTRHGRTKALRKPPVGD